MFSQTPGLIEEWFMSSKEAYVIGNLFSIWLDLLRILQNEDFNLCLIQPVGNEKVAESVMIIDAFLPTDNYSYDKSYIYLRWFLNKHCTFQKGLWEASWGKKNRVEEKEMLTSGNIIEKRYEEMSM